MSKFLLNAIVNCETEKEMEQVVDLIKGTEVKTEAVRAAIEDAQRQGFASGKGVILNHDPTKEVGKVIKFNSSTIGFYTGDRYPIVVKFERGTFEYSADNLTLVE